MSKEKRRAVIRDILALYRKYDERDIADAVEAIRSGEIFREMLTLVGLGREVQSRTKKVSRGSHAAATRSRPGARERFDAFVRELEGRNDGLGSEIANFVKSIGHRQMLQSGVSLREYAAMLGVDIAGAKLDRFIAAKKIGEALLEQPEGQCREYIARAARYGGGTSSLQEWSNIIVKK